MSAIQLVRQNVQENREQSSQLQSEFTRFQSEDIALEEPCRIRPTIDNKRHLSGSASFSSPRSSGTSRRSRDGLGGFSDGFAGGGTQPEPRGVSTTLNSTRSAMGQQNEVGDPASKRCEPCERYSEWAQNGILSYAKKE